MVFIAEIPSLFNSQIALRCWDEDNRWRSSWKASDKDLIFRSALFEAGLIPESPLSDSPLDWNCWITDFFKCGEFTGRWERMRDGQTTRFLRVFENSVKILCVELSILRPSRIVFVGEEPMYWYNKALGKPECDYSSIPHYSSVRSPDDYYGFLQAVRNIA
jgi:hypothetical protein